MRTIVPVLALLLALATNASTILEGNTTIVELSFYGVRGFYVGYNKGIYKTEVESECLNDATLDKIMDVVDFVVSGSYDISKLLALSEDAIAIFTNL